MGGIRFFSLLGADDHNRTRNSDSPAKTLSFPKQRQSGLWGRPLEP